jgi:putative transposase
MPKFPRLVVPGYPHHVTQRGVRKQQTFFEREDYLAYVDLIQRQKLEAGVDVWAYCLMPNHIHMVVVPYDVQSLSKLFQSVHHRYARWVNAKHEWRGHLWQERFYSVVMDERHALAAMRYVELNPVRAGICSAPASWEWSSARGSLGLKSDSLLDESEVRRLIPDWSSFLHENSSEDEIVSIRSQTQIGRPTGNDNFIDDIEQKTGRRVRRRNPGPRSSR